MSCGCGCGGEVVAYEEWDEEDVTAAEYQGRTVTLNKPFRTKGASKKFAVYTKNGSGTVVIVRFGDPNMEIKRDDPARRKSFRSRHNCDSPGPKWKARYWSCRQWRSGPKVEAGEAPCGCGCVEDTVEAAEPTPKDSETHDEYMSRCQEAGYSKEECMKAHEGHTFSAKKDDEDEKKKKKKRKKKGYASIEFCESCDSETECAEKGSCMSETGTACAVDEELVDGVCQKIAVTLDCEIDSMKAIVEASTGETIVEIRGVAFHEGTNKNGWSVTPEGARAMVHQMQGADLTLNHPAANEHGVGFTRNMDGGLDEAKVGHIHVASYHPTATGGYEVRYIAHVVRHELFDSLESGVWTNTEDYGVSIGGSGVPIAAEEGQIMFGEDFTFDHLAIVHKPAYERASIENVQRIAKPTEIEATFISHSKPSDVSEAEKVKAMTDETTDRNFEEEIENLKADLVLASSRVAEFESAEAGRVESERMALVSTASEMGMTGHEDLQTETIERLIASWSMAHPEPEPVVMESVESVASTEPEPVAASEAPKAVVANYLNGRLVESDEDIYSRCWNAWAKAWNGTLTGDERATSLAPTYDKMKEMI